MSTHFKALYILYKTILLSNQGIITNGRLAIGAIIVIAIKTKYSVPNWQYGPTHFRNMGLPRFPKWAPLLCVGGIGEIIMGRANISKVGGPRLEKLITHYNLGGGGGGGSRYNRRKKYVLSLYCPQQANSACQCRLENRLDINKYKPLYFSRLSC